MSTSEVHAFYDEVAAGYAELLPDTAYEAPLDLGMLDHFVSLLPAADAVVLDAGCGAGRMLGALIERGVARVEGVDLSPAMIEQARAAHPDVPLTVGALDALPFDGPRFDGLLAWYSIIHTPPHRCGAAFVELARVLKLGGLVLLGYQAGTGERRVRGASYSGSGTLPAYLHRTATLRDALGTAGFETVASADRAPRPGERHAQGFLLARKEDVGPRSYADAVPDQGVVVREVRRDDRERWAELFRGYRAFYRLTANEAVVERVWGWLHDPEVEVRGLVAERAGRIEGLAHWRRFHRPSSGTIGLYLDDLFTAPDARGAGVGRALLEHLVELARDGGHSVVRWITARDNTTARHLYDAVATATPWVTYDLVPTAADPAG